MRVVARQGKGLEEYWGETKVHICLRVCAIGGAAASDRITGCYSILDYGSFVCYHFNSCLCFLHKQERLVPHRTFSGNRPSLSLLFPKVREQ